MNYYTYNPALYNLQGCNKLVLVQLAQLSAIRTDLLDRDVRHCSIGPLL